MSTQDFTTTILVDQAPTAVFKAITNPRAWWSEEIEGNTEKLNDVFDYHYEDIHRCKIKLVEVIPGKKVVWFVMENYFKPGIFGEASHTASTTDKAEWVNTKIIFEIDEKNNKTQVRFTHEGLVPEYECYDACFNGWTHYLRESLFKLITTGKGEPNSTGNAKTINEKELQAQAGKSK